MYEQVQQRMPWARTMSLNSSSSSSDDGGCLVEVRHAHAKPGSGRRHNHNHTAGNRSCCPSSTSRRLQASQQRVQPSKTEEALLQHNWLLQDQLGHMHCWNSYHAAELHRMWWLLNGEHAAHQAAQAELHQERQLRMQAQAAQTAAERACCEAEQDRAGCEAQLREAQATIHRLQEQVKALQAAPIAPATSLDWPPPAVKIVPGTWPGNATLQDENARLQAQVAELQQELQAHSAETMVLQEEDSCSCTPAEEMAAFKAKWASPDDAQSCDDDDDDDDDGDEEDVVAELQAAMLAADQRGLLASDAVAVATEVVEEDCVLDLVFSGYDGFDRQAPAAGQQQAQPMVDALGGVDGPAQQEEQGAAATQMAAPASTPAAGGAAGGMLHDALWYVEEAIVADDLKHMQQLRAFRNGLAERGLKF